jgi:hypothetical protein
LHGTTGTPTNALIHQKREGLALWVLVSKHLSLRVAVGIGMCEALENPFTTTAQFRVAPARTVDDDNA